MSLIPRFIYGELDLTEAPCAIEFGSDFGNPENVVEVVQTLLQDGEVLDSSRRTNRTLTLTVLIEGADLLEVAQAEARLIAEADKVRNTLALEPGDGIAPTTVFDTFRAQPRWERDDNMEQQGFRRFVLEIPALPHPRSVNLTTEIAEGIPSVGTTINAADSLTGWSTPIAQVPNPLGNGTYLTASPQPSNMVAVDTTTKIEGTGSVAAKAYRVNNGGNFRTELGAYRIVNTSLTLTQNISIAAGAYLSFAVKFDSTLGYTATNSQWNQTFQKFGTLDTFSLGAARTYKNVQSGPSDFLLSDAIIEALGDGWTRYTFRIDQAMTVSTLNWTSEHAVPDTEDPYAAERPRILVDQVALTASATLGNQILKTIRVGGSARSTGALHVSAPSDSVALGQVIAYTVPAPKVATGFKPDLAQWVGAGATTDTVAGRTGVYTAIGISYGSAGSPVFTAPASIFKSGAFTLVAPLYRSTGTDALLTVEASLMIGATVVSTQELSATVAVVAGAWQMHVLGTMYLPPTMVQSATPTATIRFRFKSSSSIPTMANLYVLPVEGDLTVIDCGTGTVGPGASSHLWLDSPSPEQPQGGYWRSSAPNRVNALSAWSTTVVPGTHVFEAGEMLAFAAADTPGVEVSFEYYKAWFANAAEDG